MNPVLVISGWEGGVQIVPQGVRVTLSAAEALGRHLHGKAWVDFNPACTTIAIHPNSSDPNLQKEVLNITASFFRNWK